MLARAPRHSSAAPQALKPHERARGVVAVLGPTNTGKTHLAIERMAAHSSGLIGLPLRLLAREVYGRLVAKVGAEAVALVTGEEKIKPKRARYWVSTIEAMPRDIDPAFVAVDEIQLAADLDRGRTFTDRLLNMRGREETLLIGSGAMRPLVERLLPGVTVVTRPRLSNLSFAGDKKLTRLPRRSALVAFSAEEVYAVAELVRRQKGGAAVVLGALSPRTRNAQVELFQNGDVDYLVATDAIGMGLNLEVDHVAFAGDRKFDGHRYRSLFPAEIGQIAGRAGRHLRDGTFGTTGRCPPFDADLIEAVEDHRFPPLELLQWRNAELSFGSIDDLIESLNTLPREPGLARAPMGEDQSALEALAREHDVRDFARGSSAVERVWEACQVPDYRRLAPQAHAELCVTLLRFLMRGIRGRIPNDWFARQVAELDRDDGDIDALSARIAAIRTWSFVANRPDWVPDPEHWQGETRKVEDKLSDALHERLTQRFVDRRTSVLMRRLRENAFMEAEVTPAGDVTVEGQHVGRLLGFQFAPDAKAANGEDAEGRALRAAAAKALAGEIESRAGRLAGAPDEMFSLATDGFIRWTGEVVARLAPGDKTLAPTLRLLADEQLTGEARERVEERLKRWLAAHVAKLLGPLVALEATELQGLARGVAYQLAESLGVLERGRVADDLKALDQGARSALRALGVRFGAYHVTMPALLKPGPRTLAAQLWALKQPGEVSGLADIAHLASSGRTSIPVDPAIPAGLYRAAGFRVAGPRAIRVDILERLADLIRPAIAYRAESSGEPPPGAADGDAFVVTGAMTSLAGCSGEDFAAILRSLGYQSETRLGPALRPRPQAAAKPADAPDAAASSAVETAEAVDPVGVPSFEEMLGATLVPLEAPRAAAPAEDMTAQATEADAVEAAPEGETTDHAMAGSDAGEGAPREAQAEGPAPSDVASSEAPSAEAASDETTSQAVTRDEGGAAGATQADASESVAPEAPPTVEVWRVARREARGPRPHQGRGDGRREGHGGRHARGGAGRGPGPRAPGGEGGRPPVQAGEGQPRHENRDRPPRGPRPPSRNDARPDRRTEGPPREGGGPGGGRPERDRHGSGPRPFADRPNRPSRAPDPDSPFAKLAALKQALVQGDDSGRGGGRGSSRGNRQGERAAERHEQRSEENEGRVSVTPAEGTAEGAPAAAAPVTAEGTPGE